MLKPKATYDYEPCLKPETENTDSKGIELCVSSTNYYDVKF